MEQIFLAIIAVTLCIILVQNKKLQNDVNNLKNEQQRHNNIQSVILEQVDKIATNVGV